MDNCTCTSREIVSIVYGNDFTIEAHVSVYDKDEGIYKLLDLTGVKKCQMCLVGTYRKAIGKDVAVSGSKVTAFFPGGSVGVGTYGVEITFVDSLGKGRIFERNLIGIVSASGDATVDNDIEGEAGEGLNVSVNVLTRTVRIGDVGSVLADYNLLENRPSIGGVTLEGDRRPSDLGMYSKVEADEKFETKESAAEADKRVQEMLDGKVDKEPGKGLSANDLTDERAGKVDKLKMDGRANEYLNGAGIYSRPVRQGYGVSVADDNTVSVDPQVTARQSDVASVAADLAAQKAKEQGDIDRTNAAISKEETDRKAAVAALQSLIDTLNPGYQFMGVATPETNPGTPDQKVFYVANGKDTYPTFGGIEVSEDEVVILYYDTAWHKLLTGIASDEKLSELESEVNGCFYDVDVPVDKPSQRSNDYNLTPGSRIVIKATQVAGTGTKYNVNWIKAGGNEEIFLGMKVGYVSDILTVPDDATGVNIFFLSAATGNVYNLKIYDATLPAYLTETTPKLNERVTTEEGKMAAIEEKMATIEGKAVNFIGTDGISPGTQGFVPAPDTIDKDKFLKADGSWEKPSDYFYNENVSVDKDSHRFKSYMLEPGSKIVIRVSLVSGTTTKINLYWIKEGGNEILLTGYPIGYITDVLTVPDDATGVQIFMNSAASGNVNKIEIWDATKTGYFTEKIGQFGFDFLNNRKMISKTVTIPANNAAMDLITISDTRLTNLSGDIYAYISCSPKIDDNKYIRFWNAEDFSSASVSISGIEMRQDKLFKIFDNKILRRVDVLANAVATNTEVTIVIFAIVPSDTYLKYPLYGKKIMCFGDSITEFKSSITDKRYSDHLQDYSQAMVVNAGIGGTRLAQRLTPSLTPSDNQYCVAAFDICNMVIAWATGDYSTQDAALASGLLTSIQQSLYEAKIDTLKANPIESTDIVTIFGGTNDYTGGSLIGVATADNIDKGTIYGAVNSMVSAIITAKPTMKIYFFSPIIRMFQNTISLATSSDVFVPASAPEGKKLPEFCEVIADAVKLNHCPFCNWYWLLGWNVHNFTKYFGNDYTHPYLGFQYLAEKMYKFLLSK